MQSILGLSTDVQIVMVALYLTAATYALLMFRAMKPLFGSISRVSTPDVLMHQDMVWHVLLDLVDASNSLAIRPSSDRQTETTFQYVSGPSHNLLTDPYGNSGRPLDTSMVNDHLQLVKMITSTPNLEDILSSFQRIASSDGYMIAWQLFSSMIPRLSSPFNGALGSLIHFCKQYQSVIKNRVTSANLAGQNVLTVNNYGTGMGGTIAAYARLEFGANTSIWHILYFCKSSCFCNCFFFVCVCLSRISSNLSPTLITYPSTYSCI